MITLRRILLGHLVGLCFKILPLSALRRGKKSGQPCTWFNTWLSLKIPRGSCNKQLLEVVEVFM